MTRPPLDWHAFQDDDYLALCIERLSDPPLSWVEQFVTLINEKTKDWGDEPRKVNDIGCCTGAFNVGIRDLARYPIDYHGYDLSETYLTIARQHFPHCTFSPLDIAQNAPRETEITVMSATLEHIVDWQKALGHICQATRRFVLMRTFLGSNHETGHYYKPGAQGHYPIHQFTFGQILQEAESHGFSVEILEDKATASTPKDLGCGITRTQHVCILTSGNP